MKANLPFRLCFGAALAALFIAAPAFARLRGPQPVAPSPALKPNRPPPRQVRPVQRQDHLQQWMERHNNLPLHDLQRALEAEPGFRELPAQTQQSYRDELAKLYNMTPQQRSRLLERNEAIERMTVVQRQQFNDCMTQYRALPPGRKLLVQKAFRDLHELPVTEREAIMNTERFRALLSDHERDILRSLFVWAPYFSNEGSNEGP
jgi:hypothetical protein